MRFIRLRPLLLPLPLLLSIISLSTTTLVAQNETPPAAIVPSTPQSQTLTPEGEKARAEVRRRGSGEKARVKVKLRGGREMKGHIAASDETSFTLVEAKTAQHTTMSYNEVEKVRGPGMSKGKKIGIGVAIGVGIVILIGIGMARAYGELLGPSGP